MHDVLRSFVSIIIICLLLATGSHYMQDIVILYYIHDHSSMTSIYDKSEMKDVVIGIVSIHTNNFQTKY